MRINNRILSNMVLADLNRNLVALQRTSRQMSSGKMISRPSDNPVGIAQVLSFKSVLAIQAQHTKNMEDAQGWLDTSESALNNVTAVLQRARELAVYGANGTMPQESREALACEIDQLVDELVQVANSNYGGRYIFGGTQTAKPPFTRDQDTGAVNYQGNEDYLFWEVSPGVTMTVNLHGSELFQIPDEGDLDNTSIFQDLLNLRDRLNSGSNIDESIGDLEEKIDKILSFRAVLGAKSNRLRLSLDRAAETELKVTELMSKIEDIDLARTIIDFKVRENAYEAALMTGSKILQPSLLDFLR